mmetsp:Transcript_65606/g.182454  ORF Transcript_65606/g.182454 Transcript_65606/m.182454 type:complete len:609 (+) Transcript_65606:158-1984(+)
MSFQLKPRRGNLGPTAPNVVGPVFSPMAPPPWRDGAGSVQFRPGAASVHLPVGSGVQSPRVHAPSDSRCSPPAPLKEIFLGGGASSPQAGDSLPYPATRFQTEPARRRSSRSTAPSVMTSSASRSMTGAADWEGACPSPSLRHGLSSRSAVQLDRTACSPPAPLQHEQNICCGAAPMQRGCWANPSAPPSTYMAMGRLGPQLVEWSPPMAVRQQHFGDMVQPGHGYMMASGQTAWQLMPKAQAYPTAAWPRPQTPLAVAQPGMFPLRSHRRASCTSSSAAGAQPSLTPPASWTPKSLPSTHFQRPNPGAAVSLPPADGGRRHGRLSSRSPRSSRLTAVHGDGPDAMVAGTSSSEPLGSIDRVSVSLTPRISGRGSRQVAVMDPPSAERPPAAAAAVKGEALRGGAATPCAVVTSDVPASHSHGGNVAARAGPATGLEASEQTVRLSSSLVSIAPPTWQPTPTPEVTLSAATAKAFARSEADTGGSGDDVQAEILEELLRTIKTWRQTDEDKAALHQHREEIAMLLHEEEEAWRVGREYQDKFHQSEYMCWELAAAQGKVAAARGRCEADEAAVANVLDRQHQEIQMLREELMAAQERGCSEEAACAKS